MQPFLTIGSSDPRPNGCHPGSAVVKLQRRCDRHKVRLLCPLRGWCVPMVAGWVLLWARSFGALRGLVPLRGGAAVSVPDLLTVEEAARVLRIGRTAAYELARGYLATGGAEGLPAIRVGRLLRVSRVALEKFAAISITDIPPKRSPSRATPPDATTRKSHLHTVHDAQQLPLG